MSRNESRHMLPLPSRIFSKSSSRPDLRAEQEAYGDFNFLDGSPQRLSTGYTAVSSFSTPDLTVTALPAFPRPIVPAVPHRVGGTAPAQIDAPNSRRLIKSPPRSPVKSAKSGAGSKWCRFKVKVKRAFSFKRRNNKDSASAGNRLVDIGMPYDFEHVETHGIMPLGLHRPAEGPVGSGGENLGGSAGVEQVTDWAIGCGDGTVHRTNAGDAVTAAASRELGNQDSEVTAIEDDDDSAWEDYEVTHSFNGCRDRR